MFIVTLYILLLLLKFKTEITFIDALQHSFNRYSSDVLPDNRKLFPFLTDYTIGGNY